MLAVSHLASPWFSLIDVTFSVLRKLCHSPHGMFWAGDTAQTIALGSSFRFDDLKSYLFRIEVCYLLF